MTDAKRKRIQQTLQATKQRRKRQIPHVFELKLTKLSKQVQEFLERLFYEAKWFYNYVIADIKNRLNLETCKLKQVTIKTPTGMEERELKVLGSQMKLGIIKRIEHSLKALSRAKAKGYKVGALKFKSEFTNILLPQYGITYKINFNKNRVKIQGLRTQLRVRGLDQIPSNAEIANAYLIKRASGYYLKVVCFLPKEDVLREIQAKQVAQPVGIDIGIKYQLTLTTGEKFSWYVPETKRLKRLQKQLARKQKGSRNYFKTKLLLRREWEYIKNKRKDIINKIISYLKRFPFIAVQNDNIKSWHENWFGKQVQNTGIGGLIARLKQSLATLIPVVFVDRFEPTTKTCSRCGAVRDINLSERTYTCPACGYTIDRDLNSAWNILLTGLKHLAQTNKALADSLMSALPVERREVTPVEWTLCPR